MKKLKAVVIGAGRIGSLHAKAYAENPLVQLEAIIDKDIEKAKEVADSFNCSYFDSLEKGLESVDFEIVSIATPEQSHLQIGEMMVKEGKAVLMEKPVTPTMEEAKQLLETVEKHNGFMSVNYILRKDPRVLMIKEKIESNVLGDLVSFFARRRGSYLGAQTYGKWTDLLISTAIHDLDLMIFFNRTKPVRVYGESVMKKCKDIGTEDAFAAIVKFEDGSIGSLDASWVLPSTMHEPLGARFSIIGTKGGAEIEGSNHGLSLTTEEEYIKPDLTHWPIIDSRLAGDLKYSIDDFVQTVLNEQEPSMPLTEAMKSLELVFAIRESIRTNKPIVLN